MNVKTVMNSTLAVLAGIGLFALPTVAADKKPDVSKLPAPATKAGLTFDKDIQPMLKDACLKCHGAEKPKAKYRVDSRESFIKGGDSDEKAVVVGKSADSPVVQRLFPLHYRPRA